MKRREFIRSSVVLGAGIGALGVPLAIAHQYSGVMNGITGSSDGSVDIDYADHEKVAYVTEAHAVMRFGLVNGTIECGAGGSADIYAGKHHYQLTENQAITLFNNELV